MTRIYLEGIISQEEYIEYLETKIVALETEVSIQNTLLEIAERIIMSTKDSEI